MAAPADTDLRTMLATLDVLREPGVYVFATVADARDAAALPCAAMLREREAWTVVLRRDDALEHGLFFDFEAAWLTLTVHSSLAAVGLTAAVAQALGAAGIPCNVLAGYHHDHLLVPDGDADRAIAALRALRDA